MATSNSASIIPRSYTGRDFDTAVASLTQFISTTRKESWSDFLQSNLGSALIDLMAYTLDVASFAQDASVLETFLATCKRYESALFFARSVGYVPRPYTAATAVLRSDSVPESLITYGGTLAKGSKIRGKNGLIYEVTENVTLAPGNGIIRVPVLEGATYEDPFSPQVAKNIVVTTNNAKVADASWSVFVGPTNDPDNEWTQVDSVLAADAGQEVYDVSFDLDGRLNVRFGDGLSGAIPDLPITVIYRTCNGYAGNTPARSITGSMPVTVNTPSPSSVSVTFTNYEASITGAGSTAFTSGDYLGSLQASAIQTFITGFSPLQPGSVAVTLALSNGKIITLRDNGAGAMSVVSSDATQILISSAIIYSSGAVTLTFNSNLPSGGSATADYYYVTVGDPTQVSVVGAAQGGADRESIDEMRRNIPAFIRSSDRLVTLADYRDASRAIAGVALATASLWVSGYTGNAIRIFVWGSESVTFSTTEPSGEVAAQTYTRYSQVSDTVVNRTMSTIREKSLLTVQSLVLPPSMLWLDVYLGKVFYDRRLNPQDVRAAILNSVLGYFQSASGFNIRISELYQAIRDSRGVMYFGIQRITTGNRSNDTTAEAAGATTPQSSPATLTGTLLNPVISPGSVIIVIQQATSQYICEDQANGTFKVTNTNSVSVTASSINYTTGAWSITLNHSLSGGYPITAFYNDVVDDYRAKQLVIIGGDQDTGDYWPPPGTATSSPVARPPYADGVPLTKVSNTLTYAPLQDIVIDEVTTTAHYYDSTYLYNNDILYNSENPDIGEVRAINLRKLSFTLVPQ